MPGRGAPVRIYAIAGASACYLSDPYLASNGRRHGATVKDTQSHPFTASHWIAARLYINIQVDLDPLPCVD